MIGLTSTSGLHGRARTSTHACIPSDRAREMLPPSGKWHRSDACSQKTASGLRDRYVWSEQRPWCLVCPLQGISRLLLTLLRRSSTRQNRATLPVCPVYLLGALSSYSVSLREGSRRDRGCPLGDSWARKGAPRSGQGPHTRHAAVQTTPGVQLWAPGPEGCPDFLRSGPAAALHLSLLPIGEAFPV